MRYTNVLQYNFEFVALSEEKKKAVRKCLSALEHKDTLLGSLGSTPLETDFVCFLADPVRKHQIPRPAHWRWNQCNKQTTISLGPFSLSFIKYNTRRTAGNSEGHARRKLWLFDIEEQEGKRFYFLWCERGEDTSSSPEVSPPDSPASSDLLSTFSNWKPEKDTDACDFPDLSELSWLGAFMDPCVALEFGWTC